MIVNSCATNDELVPENTEFKADLYPILSKLINLVSVLMLAKSSNPKRLIVLTALSDSTS